MTEKNVDWDVEKQNQLWCSSVLEDCLYFSVDPGPEVINFFMLNSTEHEISNAHENLNTDK